MGKITEIDANKGIKDFLTTEEKIHNLLCDILEELKKLNLK